MKVIAWILTVIILFAVLFGIYIFSPVINEEGRYLFDQTAHVQYIVGTEQLDTFLKPLTPPDPNFSIIITKIGASAKVLDNIDPNNQYYYLRALKQGIAHAQGTAQPNEVGNIFLFDHAADTFYNLNTYNVKFFLINKLQSGDEIDIFYQGNQYKYSVYDKKIVGPDTSAYMGPLIPDGKTLTLQTDYPEGTSFQRLLIFAKQTSD